MYRHMHMSTYLYVFACICIHIINRCRRAGVTPRSWELSARQGGRRESKLCEQINTLIVIMIIVITITVLMLRINEHTSLAMPPWSTDHRIEAQHVILKNASWMRRWPTKGYPRPLRAVGFLAVSLIVSELRRPVRTLAASGAAAQCSTPWPPYANNDNKIDTYIYIYIYIEIYIYIYMYIYIYIYMCMKAVQMKLESCCWKPAGVSCSCGCISLECLTLVLFMLILTSHW